MTVTYQSREHPSLTTDEIHHLDQAKVILFEAGFIPNPGHKNYWTLDNGDRRVVVEPEPVRGLTDGRFHRIELRAAVVEGGNGQWEKFDAATELLAAVAWCRSEIGLPEIAWSPESGTFHVPAAFSDGA